MRKTLALVLLLAATAAAAQNRTGGLSADILTDLGASFKGDLLDSVVFDALSTASIQSVAESDKKTPIKDTTFTYEVKTVGFMDQHSSGRCWLFTGLNGLRAEIIQRHGLDSLTLSANYLFFYDQLEKANLFLQGIIDTRKKPMTDRMVDWLFQNPIADGGQYTGVSNLITKYGIVPASVMPETYSSNNTAQMRRQLSLILREGGLKLRAAKPKEVEAVKVGILKDVYRVLALCLGVPPTEFEWQGRVYTPKGFYQELYGEDLESNYVMFMNNPTLPYGKVYEIDFDRHMYDGQNWKFINLPMDRIKEMAIESLKDGRPLYFSCDVGKYLDRSTGVADLKAFDYQELLGVNYGMDKKDRILTHSSASTHAMCLRAVDIQDGKPVKWMVENSWGPDSGYHGNIIMTDQWLDEYMFRLVVNKKYVPQDILLLLARKPVMLPAWDPMY